MAIDEPRLGAAPYVIAGISFFPLLGVPFGIAAIIWGLSTKKKGGRLLAILGTCGLLITPLIYGSLYYKGFVERGGVYDDLRKKLAQKMLNDLVPVIELYKLQNGSYPESLKILKDSSGKNSPIFLADPTLIDASPGQADFYYERVGEEHYYLRGVGTDKTPFTADDILPDIPNPNGKLGLLVDRQ